MRVLPSPALTLSGALVPRSPQVLARDQGGRAHGDSAPGAAARPYFCQLRKRALDIGGCGHGEGVRACEAPQEKPRPQLQVLNKAFSFPPSLSLNTVFLTYVSFQDCVRLRIFICRIWSVKVQPFGVFSMPVFLTICLMEIDFKPDPVPTRQGIVVLVGLD